VTAGRAAIHEKYGFAFFNSLLAGAVTLKPLTA